MIERRASEARIWRAVRIAGLGLAVLFLLGVIAGYTVAHLQDGGGLDLRSIAIVGGSILSVGGFGWLLRRDVKAFAAEEWNAGSGAGEGERLYAQQRRSFWTLLGGLAAIGAVAGFVGAFVMLHVEGGASPQMLTLAAAGIIIVALLSAYGSWRFFVSVDELELADNLWGSLIGFYAYAILFPVWWALNKIGRAPEPDDWAIYVTSVAVALAAYGFRKWRNR
jgi:uncharacterized membrane protein